MLPYNCTYEYIDSNLNFYSAESLLRKRRCSYLRRPESQLAPSSSRLSPGAAAKEATRAAIERAKVSWLLQIRKRWIEDRKIFFLQLTDRLDLLRRCRGVVAISSSSSDLVLLFSPCVLGTIFGPYKLVLEKEPDNRWGLHSSELPLPPSIVRLEEEVDRLDQGDDEEEGLSALVSRLSTLLRALLSRRRQFDALRREFSTDVLVQPRAKEPEYT